jgi:profilin
MSWQAYVDNLVATGGCKKAALLGHDGSVWAKSADLTISAAEAQKLAQGFRDPSSVQSTGIHFGGQKHQVIKADDQSIYGKLGTGGFSAAKSHQTIVLGFYDDKIQPGNNSKEVEKIADYLRESGY